MSAFHDDYSELLGAYSLDALEVEERDRVEVHLRTCPWCTAEVAEHREVASFLSHSGTDAPEGVWDKILAELSPPAPPLRMAITPPTGSEAGPAVLAPVVSLASRRTVRMRTFAAVVAAAALLLAVVGFAALDRNGTASPVTPQPGDQALQVRLIGADSKSGAQVVVEPSGKGYLVSHDLPDAGTNKLYQLWGQVDGVVLSLGTFDGETEVVNFQVDPSQVKAAQAFAVTKEQAPGVLASTQPAVMSGKVS